MRFYLKNSDGVIFVSNSAIQEFGRVGISFENSLVITNGFNKRDFEYIRPKNDKKIRYGYVGRFHEIKNQSLLIDSFNDFAKDKDVTLEIAGKGMEYNKFKHLIDSSNKDKFIWRGEVINSFDIYNNIDVLLLTSRSEGFPNVIGEAMSVGVPVISTDAGESYNIIGDSGYKVGSNKHSVLEALNNTYSNTEELTHKSKLAYQRIRENYSMSVIVDNYLNYYKKVLEE
ncbi:glycosyltransferase family 4 protein [Staphylococcus carnosus]|nr:glycosyltransferase family 4 protein [Staphylococcus carnosus]